MPSIDINGFSCIEDAHVELHPLTILIGPQASGKSLITKLFYFLSGLEIILNQSAEEGNSLRILKREISKKFSATFPPPTWGAGDFGIKYSAGLYSIHISRRILGKNSKDELEIDISPFLSEHYEYLMKRYRVKSRGKKDQDEYGVPFADDHWRIRRESSKILAQELGTEYIDSQTFVPAGRSFFTNLGKAFAVLEYGSQIDEVTKAFGRMFSALLDGAIYYFPEKPPQRIRDFISYQKDDLHRIFGGEIKISQNDRHVSMRDGRKIPFGLLSSGQQELLPLVLIIQHFTKLLAASKISNSRILYIEEPEAHLFPSAQSQLMNHLAAVSNFTSPSGYMFITTHSPYVLSTLNTLIKASSVGKMVMSRPEKDIDVDKIISRRSWVPSEHVEAYAIEDGLVKSIKDKSGLIDGEYLDSISNDISEKFVELLGMEAEFG